MVSKKIANKKKIFLIIGVVFVSIIFVLSLLLGILSGLEVGKRNTIGDRVYTVSSKTTFNTDDSISVVLYNESEVDFNNQVIEIMYKNKKTREPYKFGPMYSEEKTVDILSKQETMLTFSGSGLSLWEESPEYEIVACYKISTGFYGSLNSDIERYDTKVKAVSISSSIAFVSAVGVGVLICLLVKYNKKGKNQGV